MTYLKELFDENFLEYASYVVKERAIPYLSDGLKPVQRRILHSLFEMDDGKFNKVANVVGNTMKYHPHGDASIYSALVVLANKNLFIDRQGNFGNIFTGDPASAARYIECRLTPLAKKILFNPELTEYDPSYDGRNREPVSFPAKIPVVLVHGAEGIAVGMSTKILPHNFTEVLKAMQASLQGESFELYPDFPTGGLLDVSRYGEGNGKVLSRARIEVVDKKTILIRELPFGTTTESLINSIDIATKKEKVMVAKVNDFSTDSVEIELKLKRGYEAEELLDALYAFTDCEVSISTRLLLIDDNRPVQMSVSEVVRRSSEQLMDILEAELRLEMKKLEEKLHRRTLELIFVMERIYKNIEESTTSDAVRDAVFDGFIPFRDELVQEVTEDDVEFLLRIPIRRISAYDIGKAKKEQDEIRGRILELTNLLEDVRSYALQWLDDLIQSYGDRFPRKTDIASLEQVSVKEAAIRDLKLIYNGNKGYLGYDLKEGPERFKVSIYDRILLVDRQGGYQVIDVPDKKFVGYRVRYVGLADEKTMKSVVFTALYKNPEGVIYLKRFRIEKYIIDREYSILPSPKCELLELSTESEGVYRISYIPTGRSRKYEDRLLFENYSIKGVTARGYKITDKPTNGIEYFKSEDDITDSLPLFGDAAKE